jgi:hypothetical protein
VVLEVDGSTIRLVPVAKPGGVRWIVRLDEPAATAYAALVGRVVPIVEASLSSAAVANRVVEVRPRPPAILLEPWRAAHDRFRRTLKGLASASGAVLMTDVRTCYASISPDVVGRSLCRIGCDDTDVGPIVSTLRALAGRGVRGLPVGPEASAVLANAVLGGLDDALRQAGVRHVRWVDDVVAFTPDPESAEQALRVVGSALGALGLVPAREKTRILVQPMVPHDEVPGSLSALGAPGPHEG